MAADPFDAGQTAAFAVCVLQLLAHAAALWATPARAAVLIDTEVLLNMTASRAAHSAEPAIQRVLNFKIDVPVGSTALVVAMGAALFAVYSVSVYQAGYVTSSALGAGGRGGALSAWNLAFWTLNFAYHALVLMAVLSPAEWHYVVVTVCFLPLSVYRICDTGGGNDVDAESGERARRPASAMDAAAYAVVAMSLVASARSALRLGVLFAVFAVDAATVAGHLYDGHSHAAETTFNCRLVVVAAWSLTSACLVYGWDVVLYEGTMNIRVAAI
jgi:hypothetical protein